jgi:selenoprotein W-related protein
MIPSKGGCFEVTVGGRKLYSKLKTGKFPDEEAILKEIGAALGA